jgi:hypothetical protein
MTYFYVFLGILKNLHDVKNVVEICKKLKQFHESHEKRTGCLSNGAIYNDIPGNDINKALLHLWGQNKKLGNEELASLHSFVKQCASLDTLLDHERLSRVTLLFW